MSRSDVTIYRASNVTPDIALTSSATTTPSIRSDLHESIGVIFSSVTTAASFVLFVSSDDVTYYALNDASDAAVGQNITTAKAYAMPAALKSYPYFRIKLNAGSATATVCRKA